MEEAEVKAGEQPVQDGEDAKQGKSVTEWKRELKDTMRERLREEYAKAASSLTVGDKCEVGGNRGEICFIGDAVPGLPSGVWVGIRYNEAIGKNDGVVKGVRLFTCQPNHGVLVRPDKITVLAHKGQKTPQRPSASENLSSFSSSSSQHSSPFPKPGSRPSTPSSSESPAHFYNPDSKNSHGDPDVVIGSDPCIEDIMPRNRVGLAYDERMGAHKASCGYHPEQPARIKAIFFKLEQLGLAQRCVRVPCRPATTSELSSVHTKEHVEEMKGVSGLAQEELDAACKELDSVYLCPESTDAALLAAGGVIEATKRVATGVIKRAACVVRPPGHHAEPDAAMGFCLFGNVAVAASEARKHGWAKKVLIVDWDAHHGNGTQRMFLHDKSVLFVSIHRFDRGTFYPGGPDGDFSTSGEGEGRGFSINVPWARSGAGDAEYIQAFEQVVMPAAEEFAPDLVLVSAGFDSAAGDPLGGLKVTPEGFNWMTRRLLTLANGRMVLALEGGYSLRSISHSLAACLSAMLGDAPMPPCGEVREAAKVHTDVISEVKAHHAKFWKCFKGCEAPTREPRTPLSDKGNTSVVSPLGSTKGNAGSDSSSSVSPADRLQGADIGNFSPDGVSISSLSIE